MRWFCGLVLALAVVGLVGAFDKDGKETSKTDMDKFQGVWAVQAIERDGTKEAGDEVKKMRLSIKGDAFTLTTPDGGEHTGTLKMIADKQPKHLDIFMGGGEKLVGIYSMEKDGSLKICFNRAPGGDRPKEFSTKGEASLEVLWLKKAEK